MGYYEEHNPDLTVKVLGIKYRIYLNVPDTEDATLKTISGYCDKTDKRIAIAKLGDDCNLAEPTEYVKYIIRHELVHAFLFESGIGGDTVWDIEGQEHPEHMVEWIAMQMPKMAKLFRKIGVM